VLTKAALLDGVWDETAVGEDALAFQIRGLRQALDDDARNPRYIETVHRVGYRFIVPVTTAPSVSLPGAPAVVGRGDGSPSSPHAFPALVGREAELEQLHTVFAKASRGERQIALITGEPGIGAAARLRAGRGPRPRWPRRSWRARRAGARTRRRSASGGVNASSNTGPVRPICRCSRPWDSWVAGPAATTSWRLHPSLLFGAAGHGVRKGRSVGLKRVWRRLTRPSTEPIARGNGGTRPSSIASRVS
jgi:hypothetical protein